MFAQAGLRSRAPRVDGHRAVTGSLPRRNAWRNHKRLQCRIGHGQRIQRPSADHARSECEGACAPARPALFRCHAPYSSWTTRPTASDPRPLLRLDGNEVETAADGIEALEKARDFRPNFIFLDLGLPRMNGYDVCRSIRGHGWGEDVLHRGSDGLGSGRRSGAHARCRLQCHSVKPVGYETLRNVLASSSMT